MSKRILVVDDEQSMRETLKIMLEKEGFSVELAVNGMEALYKLKNDNYDLVLTDLKMPELDGINLIETINTLCTIPIIIMTAYASKEDAIKALNLGATFFIEKPFKKQMLIDFINRVIKSEVYVKDSKQDKYNWEKYSSLEIIIGSSQAVCEMKNIIQKVAKTDSNVLITGESGTGKEIVARTIHNLSNRVSGPFVAINFGAIPTELMESEVFGHLKGSFTGAIKDKTGLMEEANGGTFFLDEISNASLSIQIKILRAIQEKEILPVGGHSPQKVDVRFIAASNENLEEAIKRNEFRKDLYYRLNVINIHIPPLRERKEDIELLFTHFLREKDKSGLILSKDVDKTFIEVLKNYEWPGNIRELENVVERLVALSHDGGIGLDMVPDHIRKPKEVTLVNEKTSTIPSMEDIEKAYIHWMLTQYGGQKQKAAEVLGIGRTTLDRKIEKYGLNF